MTDRPITGKDALLYIDHVAGHGLHKDIRWLLDVGRFPVGCRILDVGCGTGTLVAALAAETVFARSVIGVELSSELAHHAGAVTKGTNGSIAHADFLSWAPPTGWQPETIVMAFFLHHCDDPVRHLRRAAALLPHGGRLYVLDRVAVDQSALEAFPRFWEEHYSAAHEWHEEMPRLLTRSSLNDAARQAGFAFAKRTVCPHDRRASADRFPKTLTEFWRQEPGRVFPPVLVVSPAHVAAVEEIVQSLDEVGLSVSVRQTVNYSDALIRTFYERCPWRDLLLRFVAEVCPEREAIALRMAEEFETPLALDKLGKFKKTHRDRWPSIEGPKAASGFKAIILPFHVPEPYESETVARLVGLLPVGR